MSASRPQQQPATASSTNPQTCGDEQLDQLIANRTIILLQSCSNNDVYGDPELHIIMKDGTAIFSTATFMTKELQINFDGYTYFKGKVDTSGLVSLIGAITGQNLPRDYVNFAYHKISIANAATGSNQSERITAADFDNVFNALPEAIRNVINRRHQQRPIQVSMFNAGNKTIPVFQL